jgi:hypothetical protein
VGLAGTVDPVARSRVDPAVVAAVPAAAAGAPGVGVRSAGARATRDPALAAGHAPRDGDCESTRMRPHTWQDVLEIARDHPYVNQCVMAYRLGRCTRDEALIEIVLGLYAMNDDLRKRLINAHHPTVIVKAAGPLVFFGDELAEIVELERWFKHGS